MAYRKGNIYTNNQLTTTMPKVLPNTFTLRTDQVVRVNAEDACKVVRGLVNQGQSVLRYSSGIMGPPFREWIEVHAFFSKGRYVLAFGVEDFRITNLWVMITPKCACFSVDHEGAENPAKYITIDQLQALTKLLITPKAIPKPAVEQPKSKAARKKVGLR